MYFKQAMFGQQYGVYELPSCLPFETFQSLRTAVKQTTDDETLDFFDVWYKKDSNSEPTVYVLQPVHEVLGKQNTCIIVQQIIISSYILFSSWSPVRVASLERSSA